MAMNKCDLEETKKLIEMWIDEAVADVEGWYRNPMPKKEDFGDPVTFYRSGGGFYPYMAALRSWTPDLRHPTGLRAVARPPSLLNSREIEQWNHLYGVPPKQAVSHVSSSRGYWTTYEEITTVNVNVNDSTTKEKVIPPEPEPKYGPASYKIMLNGQRVAEAEEGSQRYEFFKALDTKFDEQEECQRLLTALNPEKEVKEEPEAEEEQLPEADTSSLATTIGAVVLFCLFLFALTAAVITSHPDRPVVPANTPVEVNP